MSRPILPLLIFLLQRILNTEPAVALDSHAQKTNLYFTNPFWLQYQLDTITSQKSTGQPVSTEMADEDTPDHHAESMVDAVKEAMLRVDPSQETTGDIDDEPMPDEYMEESDAITEENQTTK
jgi:hypothetical protein